VLHLVSHRSQRATLSLPQLYRTCTELPEHTVLCRFPPFTCFIPFVPPFRCFVHVASNSGRPPIQAYSGKESLGNNLGRSCRPGSWPHQSNTSAFVRTYLPGTPALTHPATYGNGAYPSMLLLMCAKPLADDACASPLLAQRHGRAAKRRHRLPAGQ
jgi:hypothetical protein